MTSKSSGGQRNSKRVKRAAKSVPAISADQEYKVGPGRPPKEHQFKPGQSGNPKGRKRKPPSLVPDLKWLFEQALSEKVTVKQGEKEHTLTMAEAGIKQLIAQYAKGDRHARRDVINYAEKFGIDLLGGHRKAINEVLPLDHQEILDAYVERRAQPRMLSNSSPALAPTELLDDDPDDQEAGG